MNHVATVRVFTATFLFKFLIVLAPGIGDLSAAPQLSTGPGQPIEFDEARGALVAVGDAELRDGPLLVKADEIGFYQQEQRIEARGNAVLTRSGFRLLSPAVNYNIEAKTFTAESFKAGSWPLFFEGENLRAVENQVNFENTTVYFGEPGPFTLRLRARELQYDQERNLEVSSGQIGLGKLPLLPVPRFSGNIVQTPIRYTGRLGYRDNLGAYLQNEALYQHGRGIYSGLNLDLYTERGILAGPALLYRRGSEDSRLRGSLLSGYIRDREDPGLDRLGYPIDEERAFLEWTHSQKLASGLQLNGRLSWWTDSEVTRDFRPDLFYRDQNPDSFLEAVMHHDIWISSLFARFRPNDFQFIRERLPEFRIDLPAIQIHESGAWQRASLQMVRLREKPLFNPGSSRLRGFSDSEVESDRLDFEYGWFYPINLGTGIQWTPRLGTKVTHYFDSMGSEDDSVTRILGEVGFDLDIQAHAAWDIRKPLWNIDGLRHLVRTRVQYRYVPDATQQQDTIIPVDRPVLSFNRHPVSLLDERQWDFLSDRHFVRLGFENIWITRHQEYGARELARINFYQDILLDRPANRNTFDSFWTELEIRPAPWIDLVVFSRSDLEDQVLSDFRGRIRLKDADQWELSLGADYLEDGFEQYLLEYSQRLGANLRGDLRLRWDRETEELIEQEYGISQYLGRSFLLRYAVRIREGSTREDDLGFTLSLNFLGF